MSNNLLAPMAPVSRRVRAFFAPVNRVTGQAALWDPSGIASFNPDAPPAPWLDLGPCSQFRRASATKIVPLIGGAPGVPLGQVRTEILASVSLEFESWGKLQMALASGVQQMNVLRAVSTASANGSGGSAAAPVPLTFGSTAAALNVGAPSAGFTVGEVIAVDLDYTGQTGFVGSGISGGYVKNASLIGADLDYIRRISLNVARVTAINGGVLTLGSPLIAGDPVGAMQISHVAGFCDREGGSFFHEWSALFVVEGEGGDRIVFHYPRLQAMSGAGEQSDVLSASGSLERLRLAGSFRALPVPDANDGESIVCFRSYLPGAMRAI